MKSPSLTEGELALFREVFRRRPEITGVKVFGSRAKGTHTPRSDVDLALWGEIDALVAEAVASELDELPLPYRYDVKAFESIAFAPLREHIERVGVSIYEALPAA